MGNLMPATSSDLDLLTLSTRPYNVINPSTKCPLLSYDVLHSNSDVNHIKSGAISHVTNRNDVQY